MVSFDSPTNPVSVCFVIPYFGRWPRYLPVFLKSCSFQTRFHFHFFTDLPTPPHLPANARLTRMSFAELRALADQKLGIATALRHPYKLCDFKPAYGLIFGDFLKDYAFWGTCDVDLTLGDAGAFLPEKLLQNHDVLSVKRHWLAGSFAVYRNAPDVNALFQRSADWQRALASPAVLNFDECARRFDELEKGFVLAELETFVESMTHLLDDPAKTGSLRIHRETCVLEALPPGLVLRFDRGCLTVHRPGRSGFAVGHPFLHYHYVNDKRKPRFRPPAWQRVPDEFFIAEDGFFTAAEMPAYATRAALRHLRAQVWHALYRVPRAAAGRVFRRFFTFRN